MGCPLSMGVAWSGTGGGGSSFDPSSGVTEAAAAAADCRTSEYSRMRFAIWKALK